MSVTITGDRALDKKLSELKASAMRKIVRPAFTKGMRVSVKAMKAAVPAPEKAAKKSIGFKVKNDKDGVLNAKAGAGVGVKASKLKKQQSKNEGRTRPGVGITAANIHWWILGTGHRMSTATRRSTGQFAKKNKATAKPHSTGSMPSQMSPVKQGFTASSQQVLSTITEEVRRRLETEAKK